MIFLGIFVAEILVLYLLVRRVQIGFGAFFYKLTKSRRLTSYALAVFFLPGTFIHEVSHFLTALFLLVPVGNIELMPEIVDGHQLKLGSVPIAKTDPFRRFLVGVAPLVFGLILIFLSVYALTTGGFVWWKILALSYISFELGNTMFMSKRDLEGAWKILVIAVFFIIFFHAIGFRFQADAFAGIFSPRVESALQNMALFLGVPTLIDLVLVIVFKRFRLA